MEQTAGSSGQRRTGPLTDSGFSQGFFSPFHRTTMQRGRPPPLPMTRYCVRKGLHRVNPRKVAGPDNITAKVFSGCADQLADVLTDIFNISIPVPKKSSVSCLNDYQPFTFTPIIMKCFERVVKRHIKSLLPPTLDTLQFTYCSKSSTDIAITLHLARTHLENKDTYVRMLFIDFNSAFNMIIPQNLIDKLVLLGLNPSLCNWILDFLSERPQTVWIGNGLLL
ncbi:hypothetical protein H4Q32_029347 [Labeo rohita]|uniref:Reverse transcriptase domain-containing protein n=1 Tax=Labeo rohita TaxID=84645 RepID=A0ABQ8MVZ7_LABRO|nr:hypothetical protein H4Q32_029347 [Labeo rohita]